MKTITLLFLLVTITVTAQTTITVDNSEGADADFNNLQAAIDAASFGDTLYVHASELTYGDIVINDGLTLIGYSHSAADKKTMVEFVTLGANASNTRITGMNIRRNFVVNNPTLISNIIIENNSFVSSSSAGISFSDGGADDVMIRGNIIQSLGANSSSLSLNVLTNATISNNIILNGLWIRLHELTTIENNIFLGGSSPRNVGSATGDLEIQDCIFYRDGGSLDPNDDGLVFNNCLTYNTSGAVPDLVGSNNRDNMDPLFVSADDDNFEPLIDDYNLQPGSPGLNNGVGGDNIGLYSNNVNFTFNNFGFTAGIPIVTITAITSQIAPGGTLDVTIESNSN